MESEPVLRKMKTISLWQSQYFFVHGSLFLQKPKTEMNFLQRKKSYAPLNNSTLCVVK